ncbi:hypothetical protein SEPCBS57363_002662 [Sporothrix epigloea]|uniref:Major facilitator superfamily (MFS) profile domain-containing protein n=1 Tax=Sporothrix epigloea TaxID=1892477 RepID=A0ABP0DH50_9PEZI
MSSIQRKESVRLPSTDDEEIRPISPTASTATMITAPASTSSAQLTTDAMEAKQHAIGHQQQEGQQDQNRKDANVTTGKIQDGITPSNLEAMEVEAQSEGVPSEARREVKAPPMSSTRLMVLVGMAFLWTSAQMPIYFWGGIPAIVYGDIGGVDRWVWLITGHLLASAAVCPFVGALSDLIGRRYVALLGCGLVVVGQLVCAFSQNMNSFIAGMSVTGVGTGINELTALAGTAEIAPTSQRGKYIGFLILTILPFCPAVLWAQLIAANAGWRFVGVLTAVYSFAGLLILAVFYHPPPRANSFGLHSWRREVLPRIDFVGGVLSITGMVLLVVGLLWGGYQYKWSSVRVLVPLILGAVLLVAFAVWQVTLAPHPMVPRRLVGLHHEGAAGPPPRTRTMWLALIITFVSGANFFSVLMLWPSQAYNVYGHDPVGVGLRGLPFALSVLVGCIVSLAILTKCRGGNRWLLFGASIVMTAGCGSLAAATPNNLAAVYVVLVIVGLGVGGIVVPASLVAMVVCPEDLIATATALTLAVRVIGGAVGYCVYYNVFVHELVPRLKTSLISTVIQGLKDNAAASPTGSTGISNATDLIVKVIELTAASQTELIADLQGIGGPDSPFYHSIVTAGQQAYAGAYPFVYYCSIGFGVISIVASLFMDDIGPYLDEHISVVM